MKKLSATVVVMLLVSFVWPTANVSAAPPSAAPVFDSTTCCECHSWKSTCVKTSTGTLGCFWTRPAQDPLPPSTVKTNFCSSQSKICGHQGVGSFPENPVNSDEEEIDPCKGKTEGQSCQGWVCQAEKIAPAGQKYGCPEGQCKILSPFKSVLPLANASF